MRAAERNEAPTITIVYTTDDDGIHLWCTRCHAMVAGLGYEPSVIAAALVAAEHFDEVHP